MNDAYGAQARTQQAHSAVVRQVYERVLAGASVGSRYLEVGAGNRVHLLEKGAGPPVVLLHGTGNSAGFFLPLLNELEGVHVVAPDLPGVGLSDPIDLPRTRYRETAVAWLDGLLDTLELDATTLLGHSGGGMWALWYALAHPDRVKRLVLIGPPALPKTRCPLPLRLISTPGLGELLSRLVLPSPKSVLRLASFMGEKATLAAHPELVDLLVAVGRDPVADRAFRAEMRALVSPFALLSPSGWRRRSRVRPDELRQVAMPTLVVWGEHDPLGGVSVAQAATELIPQARLEVLPTGHGPWLGQPAQTAVAVADSCGDQRGTRPTGCPRDVTPLGSGVPVHPESSCRRSRLGGCSPRRRVPGDAPRPAASSSSVIWQPDWRVLERRPQDGRAPIFATLLRSVAESA